MGILTRRRFLAAACGLPIAASVTRSVGATPATHSLWRLDPAWGYPLTTGTGSDTKTRCRGRACHDAAPNRFFLTEADAIASRLHPCCLAQPVRVDVCADLNQLMTYYTARLGGIDARCPSLPNDLRSALQAAGACAVPSSSATTDPDPESTTDTTPPVPSEPPTNTTAPVQSEPVVDQTSATSEQSPPTSAPTTTVPTPTVPTPTTTAPAIATPTTTAPAFPTPTATATVPALNSSTDPVTAELPATGSATTRVLGLAAALTVAGTVAVAASNHDSTS